MLLAIFMLEAREIISHLLLTPDQELWLKQEQNKNREKALKVSNAEILKSGLLKWLLVHSSICSLANDLLFGMDPASVSDTEVRNFTINCFTKTLREERSRGEGERGVGEEEKQQKKILETKQNYRIMTYGTFFLKK